MTVGEIAAVIEYSAKEEKRKLKESAFFAYQTGAIARTDIRFPRSLAAAFPSLFGYAGDGQILASNEEESVRGMDAWFRRFNKGGE